MMRRMSADEIRRQPEYQHIVSGLPIPDRLNLQKSLSTSLPLDSSHDATRLICQGRTCGNTAISLRPFSGLSTTRLGKGVIDLRKRALASRILSRSQSAAVFSNTPSGTNVYEKVEQAHYHSSFDKEKCRTSDITNKPALKAIRFLSDDTNNRNGPVGPKARETVPPNPAVSKITTSLESVRVQPETSAREYPVTNSVHCWTEDQHIERIDPGALHHPVRHISQHFTENSCENNQQKTTNVLFENKSLNTGKLLQTILGDEAAENPVDTAELSLRHNQTSATVRSTVETAKSSFKPSQQGDTYRGLSCRRVQSPLLRRRTSVTKIKGTGATEHILTIKGNKGMPSGQSSRNRQPSVGSRPASIAMGEGEGRVSVDEIGDDVSDNNVSQMLKERSHHPTLEHSTSCYDAKLEKSSVYLHSQSRTFTRASQYMRTNKRGLSQVNVHYSQTNTAHNDRVIFTDLLKSAHVQNALINENIYTMERRLYNRRKDPTRSTTYYDRFQETVQRKSSSAPPIPREPGSPSAQKPVRTVADKKRERKKRIKKKNEEIELGYTPRAMTLTLPGPEEITRMLKTCRYLRVDPRHQPALYGLPETQPVTCISNVHVES